MAKYPYIVNLNGVWYSAGMEVPENTKYIQGKKNDIFSEKINLTQENVKVNYTKTGINRMSTAELKSFALSIGINAANDMSGSDLKKLLIKKFGL